MNTNLAILSTAYIVVGVFFFGKFFIFFDWFGMDNLELPKNKFNRINIKNGYFAFIIYLISTIIVGFLIYDARLCHTYPNWILLGFSLGLYFVVFLFLSELDKRKSQGMYLKSDLESHDLKQTKNHFETREVVDKNYQNYLDEYKRFQGNILTEFENKKAFNEEQLSLFLDKKSEKLQVIEENKNQITSRIHKKADELFQEIKSLKSIEQSFFINAKNQNETLIKLIRNLKIDNEQFSSNIQERLNKNGEQLHLLKNKNSDLKNLLVKIDYYLEHENQELVQIELIKSRLKKKQAKSFIKEYEIHLKGEVDSFIDFILLKKSSNANIQYLKRNSRNNGFDKTFFLNTILVNMFEINFEAIDASDLKFFISSNFYFVEEIPKKPFRQNGVLKKNVEYEYEPLVITESSINKFINKQKGF